MSPRKFFPNVSCMMRRKQESEKYIDTWDKFVPFSKFRLTSKKIYHDSITSPLSTVQLSKMKPLPT